MTFLQIKELLHKTIGLHANTVGESSIDRAINQRMLVTKCKNANTYYTLLKSVESELEELVEEVVVPETWFFRNVTPFEVLRDCALEILLNLARQKKEGNLGIGAVGPIKILSIPCSSGEEPYSVAMALYDAGLKSTEFSIDAVDVSKRAITKAKRAIYGKHSFREKSLGIQNKYFEKIKPGYRLLPKVGETVKFHQGNILSDRIKFIDGDYDIILCRNLLIYFDRETQHKIIEKLTALLKSGGFLFVGHAEAGQIDKEIYTKINVAKAFAFCKKTVGQQMRHDLVKNEKPMRNLKEIYDQLVEVTRKDIELSNKINNPVVKSINVKKDPTVIAGDALLDVEKLINKGYLLDAEKLCEKYLQKQPDNSNAYYYLGLISSMRGSDGGAEALLHKAIYLSPNNRKALSLSAVLAEKRGDDEVAESLRRREKIARDRESK